MKIFHTTKCRAYPHERLNTSKGVIRSRELALAKEEEMSTALGKQGVTNIKRITIRKGEEKIETNSYILTFNQPYIPNDRLLCREGRIVHSISTEVFQMPKIWTPHGSLQRTIHTCQMRWKGPRPYGWRLLERNEICQLPTKSSGLCKILRIQQKRKRNLRWNTRGMHLSWKQGKL